MAQPGLEVADIFRDHGPAWREANRGHVSLDQLKVMSAIERCRTAALGGHVARCENKACAHTIVAYNSCRNRHCPKCHVWTAPAVQEESAGSAMGRVRSCIRPIVAATLAAGHDVIRGSGPNQGAALMRRVTLGGFSQSNGSTVSHHVVFTPAIRERYVYMVYALLHC
jgi:Transposase zinc-binding domain